MTNDTTQDRTPATGADLPPVEIEKRGGVDRRGDIAIRADDVDMAVVHHGLAQREAMLAARLPEAQGPTRAATSLLLFELGGETFAIPLDDVAQVTPMPRMTTVPGAPARLLGLFSLHGRVHNIFDPSAFLGVTPETQNGGELLVLRHPQPQLALRVDRTSDIATTTEPLNAADATGLTRYVTGDNESAFTFVHAERLVALLLARTLSEG